MNKINPALHDNLASSLMGRLRLQIFKKITGTDNLVPTPKKVIDYFKRNHTKNHVIIAIATYLLVDNDFLVLEYDKLYCDINIEELFKHLDESPLKKPMFYEVNGFLDDAPIGVFISCHELADVKGHFYEVVLLSENNFMEKFGICNIRTSQACPEPAFSFLNAYGQWITSSKSTTAWKSNSTLQLAVQALNYLSKNHLERFVSLKQSLHLGKKDKFKGLERGRDDPQYMRLVQQAYLGQIVCHVAYIEIELIIPFDFDECFTIPLYEIVEGKKFLEDFEKNGVVVYDYG